MTSLDPALLATPPTGVPVTDESDNTASSPGVFAAVLDVAGTLDARDVETKVLRAATNLLSVDTASLWLLHGDGLVCPVAVGEHAAGLVGARLPATDLDASLPAEDGMAVITASLASAGGATGALRVARPREPTGDPARGELTPAEREVLNRLAAAAGVALGNARHVAANDRARDLSLVMEMSREIASTLDLDRVMRSVVNLAMKAVPFDRG